jgi:guanylate kinase
MKLNRLIILTGPSCVGKTPSIKAFHKMYPELAANLKKIVLYNTRLARPSEKEGVDYYFRSRQEIEKFRDKKKSIVIAVRGDLQVLDVAQLLKQLKTSDVFYEGNTYIAKILLQHELLKSVQKLSIFLSPFSQQEIKRLKLKLGEKGFENHVFETMQGKLLRRAKNLGKEITKKELMNINQRAADAFQEIEDSKMYDAIIPNHDGEDSSNWNEPIPENSDAYFAIKELAKVLKKDLQVKF